MPSWEGALKRERAAKVFPAVRGVSGAGGGPAYRGNSSRWTLRGRTDSADFYFPTVATLFRPRSKGAGHSWSHPGRVEPDGQGTLITWLFRCPPGKGRPHSSRKENDTLSEDIAGRSLLSLPGLLFLNWS